MQALASRRGLGTCAKLCSVVSAMSYALHLLMFCFPYLCNITIPKHRETLSLFPHGTREITGTRYPLRPWNDRLLGTLDALATDFLLEPIAVWNWLVY